MKIYKNADLAGELKEAAKWQVIEYYAASIDIELKDLESVEQQMDHLSKFYPSLYIFILKSLHQSTKIKEYQLQYKSCENDPYKYSVYIHGYLLPWFEHQRVDGKIHQGRQFLQFNR